MKYTIIPLRNYQERAGDYAERAEQMRNNSKSIQDKLSVEKYGEENPNYSRAVQGSLQIIEPAQLRLNNI